MCDNPDHDPIGLKISTWITPTAVETFAPNMRFLHFILFKLSICRGQEDGQTDGRGMEDGNAAYYDNRAHITIAYSLTELQAIQQTECNSANNEQTDSAVWQDTRLSITWPTERPHKTSRSLLNFLPTIPRAGRRQKIELCCRHKWLYWLNTASTCSLHSQSYNIPLPIRTRHNLGLRYNPSPEWKLGQASLHLR